ncbi:MAG: glycoside hydrolase family 20 zincin-like fold domain-containing protein, partial [bacterium]|nr:glycoside hydrolase family 20 zincin-like fold domain-containing protein [bacterium]
ARLTDYAVKAGKVLLVAPQIEELRSGREQLLSLLGNWRNITVSDKAGAETRGYDTVVLVGTEAVKQAAGLSIDKGIFGGMKPQGYALQVAYDAKAGMNVVALAGFDRQADFWAIQTLRQMSYNDPAGEAYIREGAVEDWPALQLRGFKRFQGFEGLYKANLVNASIMRKDIQRNCFADTSLYEYHPVKAFNKEAVLDPEKAITELNKLIDARKNEKSIVAVMMDDVVGEKPVVGANADKYGDYYSSVHAIIDAAAARVRETAPGTTLYFMPQFYFSRNGEFGRGGKALRRKGPLPQGVGVMTNGPEVNSLIVPTDSIRLFKENISADKSVGALIYCPIYDIDGYFYGVPPKSAEIGSQAAGFIVESANPLSKLTYCDWMWNPENYSVERSEMLACREIMGLERWKDLYNLISAMKRVSFHPLKYEKRETVIEKAEREIAGLRGYLSKVNALADADLTGRTQVKEEYERSADRMFGKFHLDDMALITRAVSPEEIKRLNKEPLKRIVEEKIIPKEDFAFALGFEEAQGRQVYDLSGHAGPAVLYGDALRSQGVHDGGGLYLNGSSGTMAVVPFVPGMNSQEFTLSFWVKCNDLTSYNMFFSHPGAENGKRFADNVMTGPMERKTDPANGKLYVTGLGVLQPSAVLADDRWHHLIVMRDSKGEFSYFLDGELQCTRKTEALSRSASSDPVFIGGTMGPKDPGLYSRQAIRNWENMKAMLVGNVEWHEKRTASSLKFFVKEATAVKAGEPVKIDGHLDDAGWKLAGVNTGFLEAGKPVAPAGNMEFMVLHDKDYLYLGARGAKNAVGAFDPLRIMLDAAHNHSQSYDFTVIGSQSGTSEGKDFIEEGTGPGASYDAFFSQTGGAKQDITYESGWTCNYTFTDKAWELEVRIPLAALGISSASGHVSGLQVMYGRNLWSYRPEWRGNVDPELYGHMIFE